jgi:rare lipoprotein A (peptidoglycan hydrolase)
VQPGDVTVSASGDGITVSTRASALLRNPLEFTGNAGRAAAGRTVEIERRGKETGGRWAPTTHGVAVSDGSFAAVWPVNHIGRFAIRAVVEQARRASAASVSPALTITVYRPSVATVYGPGFFGRRTACGKMLRRGTLGLANRTLPCGTPVAIYYGGRTIVVPVIDRGPYAHHADWDLTTATARALGVPGTVTLGAVSLRRPA